MKRYDHIDKIQIDKSLMGDEIWAFNKLDGQNLGVKYNARRKEFTDFTSRKRNVDETDDQFGEAVKWFKIHYANPLKEIIKAQSKKGSIFNGIEEITFFFEWYGEHSFAGFHQEGDELKLVLIDVFMKKKGYIEPKPFYVIFGNSDIIEIPELIYRGKLNQTFIDSITDNDWTKDECQYPTVKEGVVIRRSTILKGQNMPKAKIKTKWWIDKLHVSFNPDLWDELE